MNKKKLEKPKNFLIIFLIPTTILFAIIFYLSSVKEVYTEGITIDISKQKEWVKSQDEQKIYGLYEVNTDKLLKSFKELNEAIDFGDLYKNSEIYIKEKDKTEWLWDNIPKYHVYDGDKLKKKFKTYSDSVKLAKEYSNGKVYDSKQSITVWSNIEIEKTILLSVPFIHQLPELLRGCEVTSLTMLLQYININVDKMTLAEQIEKDMTPYRIVDGVIYFGDPSFGFLGSMTDKNKTGYGANHAPIYRLLQKYIKDRAIDITGSEFEDIYYFLNENAPVWVITNTDLKKLNSSEFYTWQTPSSKTITATNKEHSVLIVGYDEQYIYINDPLYSNANRKVNKKDFIEAWEQMGHQAVTYIP